MTAANRILPKLKQGGVCILPTETVYGLAGRADNTSAIDQIYALKDRDYDKPLALCVKDLTAARKVAIISPLARDLAQHFWPGPLTLVVPARLPRRLDYRMYGTDEDGQSTLALRRPDIRWPSGVKDLPLALTSANFSGDPECYSVDAAWQSLGRHDIAALDKGELAKAKPTTILSVSEGAVKALRMGDLQIEDFAAFNIRWASS